MEGGFVMFDGWSRAYVVNKACIIRKLLAVVNSQVILDVGSACGIGETIHLESLQSRFKSYFVHLDIDRLKLLKAKDAHRRSDFVLADATNLPLINEVVDLVFFIRGFGAFGEACFRFQSGLCWACEIYNCIFQVFFGPYQQASFYEIQ
jgi:hypothetical protein